MPLVPRAAAQATGQLGVDGPRASGGAAGTLPEAPLPRASGGWCAAGPTRRFGDVGRWCRSGIASTDGMVTFH
jgi:hypothetical protein